LKRKSWVLFLVVGFCVLFAGILVFSAWAGGLTVGLMGNAEVAEITKIRFVENIPAGDSIKVTIRNSGTSTVTIAHVSRTKSRLLTLIQDKHLPSQKHLF
jgi:hypothetical protein